MATKSEPYGKATLRWQPAKDGGFEGAVIVAGKRGEILSDENEDRLVARLRNEAGKREPNYAHFRCYQMHGRDSPIKGGMLALRHRGVDICCRHRPTIFFPFGRKAQELFISGVCAFGMGLLAGCSQPSRQASTPNEKVDEIRAIAAIAHSQIQPGRAPVCVARLIEGDPSFERLAATDLDEAERHMKKNAGRRSDGSSTNVVLEDAVIARAIGKALPGNACTGSAFLQFARVQLSGRYRDQDGSHHLQQGASALPLETRKRRLESRRYPNDQPLESDSVRAACEPDLGQVC